MIVHGITMRTKMASVYRIDHYALNLAEATRKRFLLQKVRKMNRQRQNYIL